MMSCVFEFVAAVICTEASCERGFSRQKEHHTPQRNRLTEEHLQQELFLATARGWQRPFRVNVPSITTEELEELLLPIHPVARRRTKPQEQCAALDVNKRVAIAFVNEGKTEYFFALLLHKVNDDHWLVRYEGEDGTFSDGDFHPQTSDSDFFVLK
jgi:hypothetical protein